MISLVIAAVILVGAGNVLWRALHILVAGVPKGLTASEVAEAMNNAPGVAEIHDLHVWTASPGYVALSAHVALDGQSLSEAQSIMNDLEAALLRRFGIEYTTIQVECESCAEGTLVCWYRDRGSNHDKERS